MLDAAKEAESFAAGRSRRDFDRDRMLVLSVIKAIEVIGEAAVKVSDECKAEYKEIPWLDIIGMRNRLIHGYFDINLDVVWDTVSNELPDLIKKLEGIEGFD